jgi:transposase-like protein
MPVPGKQAAVTANLQGWVTVREAARLMNVSERSIYMARQLLRSGRGDLVQAAERGEISLHAALQVIAPKRPKDGLAPLIRAWNSATETERLVFLLQISRLAGPTGDGGFAPEGRSRP